MVLSHLSYKTTPLHQLLKKEAVFNFDENYKHCFDNVKDTVKDSWTLGLYDPEEFLVLEVDASTKGNRVCLIQNNRPISYSGKSLTRLNPTIVTLNVNA